MRRALLLLALALGLGAYERRDAEASTDGPQGVTTPASAVMRAEVFLVRWEVTTFVAMTPDTVRTAYHAMSVLRDDTEIAGLVRLLGPVSLPTPTPAGPRRGDFRLVVDLVHADGTKESFAADTSKLVRLSDGASRPIDAAFKQRFSFANAGVTP